jgi:hypothetical protein
MHEFFSPKEVAARPLDELIDFLMERGKSHFEDIRNDVLKQILILPWLGKVDKPPLPKKSR